MKTLYESLLDDEDIIVQKSEKYMEQLKFIEDCGFLELNPSSGGNPTDWLKKLNIKTDYTEIFEPYVKLNKNLFNKYSKEYSGLAGIIFNMLLLVKKSHREIYVWDEHSTGPRPDGLIYMENLFTKKYHRDICISCADMIYGKGSIIAIRLEVYDAITGSFTYFYFEEDKFDKFIN